MSALKIYPWRNEDVKLSIGNLRFSFSTLSRKSFGVGIFLPRVIWGFYAIFANIEYFRLNKEFWDKAKIKR
ncbi:MAG: hypothetical protein EBQ94_02425 [Flavobacteriales bacterium]|nr:hypothetical protein [Crocinitomicaceae bacterium]NBX79225.1 hypothetical protein [Flavobacteriales bacterium]NCA22165.1 hypothetical protein [Crocinitomicaceae bacterium]